MFVSYVPILYNGVLWPGIRASSLSGLTGYSHYRQVSTGLHTVSYVYIIIELDYQWVVLLGIGSYKWRTLVKVYLKGEVAVSRWNKNVYILLISLLESPLESIIAISAVKFLKLALQRNRKWMQAIPGISTAILFGFAWHVIAKWTTNEINALASGKLSIKRAVGGGANLVSWHQANQWPAWPDFHNTLVYFNAKQHMVSCAKWFPLHRVYTILAWSFDVFFYILFLRHRR